MFQNSLPGILLLIRWCKSTCLQITPYEFFNTAPKQCHRRQEVLCPSLSITSFTSPDFLQLFFSHTFPILCLFLCVFFNFPGQHNLPKFQTNQGLMWKDVFSEICCCWDRCYTKLKQPPRTLMLQCLKKTWESIDWQMIFNQNHAQDAVRPNKTQISQCLFVIWLVLGVKLSPTELTALT